MIHALQLKVITLICLLTESESAFGKENLFFYGNIQNEHKGFEIIQYDYLVANVSKTKIEDCQIECVQHRGCLSVIVKTINPGVFACLMFNWSSSEYKTKLTSQSNATTFLLQNACLDSNPCQNGGECIANTGPYRYICNCTGGFVGRHCQKKCILFDFETGKLDGWSLTGSAFNNQPTYGDNINFRSPSLSSKLRGNWYIATYENRPKPTIQGGKIQTTTPIGTMTSSPFIIKGSKIKFLIAGGTSTIRGSVQLLVEGSVVYTATSPSYIYTLTEKYFDVSRYREKPAQIRIIDSYSGWFGHVSADHFQDTACTD